VKPGELAVRRGETAATMAKRPAAYPHVLATSARAGDGIPELRGAIARLMAERDA
jgi:GTP-binding protein